MLIHENEDDQHSKQSEEQTMSYRASVQWSKK